MATVANKDSTSAMAKGLGGCAAVGTFFSIIDTARNPSLHNLTSVCIFGFACWALFKAAVLVKRPSFGTGAETGRGDTVLAWGFGTPAWVRRAIWVGLFLVMICLDAMFFIYGPRLGLSAGGVEVSFMAFLAIYPFACQRLESTVCSYLRPWYPDRPSVAIGSDGFWITGTQIPWSGIRAICRTTRRLKIMRVDTIVVQAQAPKRVESIEIDLSNVVDDADTLYAKLRSAAEAHGATLLPEGQEWGTGLDRKAVRQRVRAAHQRSAEWRASLPLEIAKTEAQLKDAHTIIAEAEAKIGTLEAALASGPAQPEQIEKQVEQARKSLETRVGLRDATEKLLATQRHALAKR